ncbi:DUF6817 domain-containing protein [Massilia luteola]|uniref:DUF6817 domain-containing protein n=1 Tax=Massilia luteola TaxID=3081751 RepID=UPI002ACBF481|nr:glycosyltransferase [Massilia sp. Gc5]
MSGRLEEFLYRCGTTDIRHGRRSLAEQLHGTHELLQKWEADEAVCVAGLFHRVYGTNVFRYSALQITHRKRPRALIGERHKLMHVTEASPWSGNQTALNLVLKDMYHELPSEFNVGSTRMTPEKLVSARIVHYVGKRKPWQSEEPFGVNQIRLAGQDMCDTLLRLWKKYAPEE